MNGPCPNTLADVWLCAVYAWSCKGSRTKDLAAQKADNTKTSLKESKVIVGAGDVIETSGGSGRHGT